MSKYTFSVRRLGEIESHQVKALSEDDAWKALALKINMENVDRMILVTTEAA
ncbi:hypothetical protein [Pantoea agglomerans]|uniref:hypothetical protein n=1 Tax=Enterobacter agglomerans TaxID=549 RepID=UPI003DA12146